MGALAARVSGVVDHGNETRSLFLERPLGWSFVPGQFVSCQLRIDGTIVTKPYTIASSPDDAGDLEILFDRVPGGRASAYLWGLAVGDTLDFTGPWGTFTCAHAPTIPTAFIAIGTGIAAIRPMLHRATRAVGPPIDLLYATAHPLYTDELDAVPHLTIERVDTAHLIDRVATRWVTDDADRNRHFYVCGIGPSVLTLRDLLRGAGYARRAVQYEAW